MTTNLSRTPELVSVERLREVLEYEAVTGTLRWRVRDLSDFQTKRAGRTWNARYAGKVVGHTTKAGYRQFEVDDVGILVHRAIFALEHGHWPSGVVTRDARRGRSDNRVGGLSDITQADHNKMKVRTVRGRSGVPGVYPSRRRWKASLGTKIGAPWTYFDTFDEAVAARAAATGR